MKYWWLKLARYALPQWRGLAFVALATVATIGVKLLAPWPLKLIVDYALVNQSLPESLNWIQRTLPGSATARGLLAWFAAATVVLFLAKRLLKIAISYVKSGITSRMKYDLAADLFHHLQKRSLIFHGKQRVGDLMKRVTADCACVGDLVMQVYLPLITSLIMLVSMFAVMWQLSPVMAVLALGMAIPLGMVTGYFAGPISELGYQGQQSKGEVMAHAEQTLSAVPVVQAYGGEPQEDRRFRSLMRQSMGLTVRTVLYQEKFNVTVNALGSLATAAVMLVGGGYVLQDSISVGTLLVFLSYFTALSSPIETFAYLGAGFATAGAGARRVLEVLREDGDCVRDAPGARPLPKQQRGRRGHIRLENVTFGYEPDRPVLHDICLQARPGELVALVGRSGAGKSTLVSLITRLYDPWSGRVQFDGIDIRNVRLRSLCKSIAIVLQEPFLFRLSVAENIAYGRPDASRDEIIAAAEAAQADEFIRKLPSGYDTVIGERGVTLSGGEKQRLSIARALLKDAPVLILDEPTSALDAQTEATLVKAMERLMQGRTTFIIAHRLSTIRKADRIVVLENGRIVENGSHDQLLAENGTYSQLRSYQYANV